MLMLVETQISTELTFDFPADLRQHSTDYITLFIIIAGIRFGSLHLLLQSFPR